jgi:hypothetical protein
VLSVLVLTWLYATAAAAVLFVALVVVQSVAHSRQHVARLAHVLRRPAPAHRHVAGAARSGSRA